ncbi:MFS transporter [Bacillus fonticola]|uniref:MFS transporter n=1 Tax=Bacillus fonticola TaxID=2728853 RepID=UPI0014761353|nr:MFS transporter [Bacillus fonticola]
MRQRLSNSRAPFATKFYYGWVIVVIGALGIFFSGPGQTYSISVFVDSYIDEFGWSRSDVTNLYSGATFLAGIGMMYIGRVVDRFGQRYIAVIIGVLLAITSLWNAMVGNMIMLFFGFFLLRILGQGTMTLIPNTLVPQWFLKKRGTALSLMAIGGFASSATFPIMNNWLVQEFGWRASWMFWGVAVLVIFVPLAFFLIRNKPEDLGLRPDGEVVLPKDGGDIVEDKEENWTLQEAKQTRAYWLILSCIGIPALVNTGLTFHLVSIFSENGLSPSWAATILSVMAIFGFFITPIAGTLLDRVPVTYVLAAIFIGEIIFLLLVLVANSAWAAILFGVIWGMNGGFERIALNYVWPSFFGRKALGSIKGTAMSVTVIGSAIGPLPFAYGYDAFGGYTEVILFSTVFPIVGVICALFAKKPAKASLNRTAIS